MVKAIHNRLRNRAVNIPGSIVYGWYRSFIFNTATPSLIHRWKWDCSDMGDLLCDFDRNPDKVECCADNGRFLLPLCIHTILIESNNRPL